ncbi:hypothetical protein P4O66_014067, partial [Electrophorus voltai]
NISKTCTEDGWTDIDPSVLAQNCGYSLNFTEGEDVGEFLVSVRIGYTIGHTMSLISLIVAVFILCFFSLTFAHAENPVELRGKTDIFMPRGLCRKLHCTRNYIHVHLFLAFIVKAVSVIMKDVVLYVVVEPDECDSGSVGCKAAMVFFQYGVMASFFWLLVEGLFLHALLAVSFFSHRKYFWWYILIGWGEYAHGSTVNARFMVVVTSTTSAASSSSLHYSMEHYKSILKQCRMNFVLFICIIRILRQKINCRDIGRSESNQHSKLAKSTLLLIPLFGINYIIFAFIPHDIQSYMRLVFDVILGSFQGFCVAVLYCFLNGEVQSEIKRKWRRWHMQRFLDTDIRYQQPSLVSNGNATQITMLTKCSPSTQRASSCPDNFSTI